jgi:uncharacterized protein (DUF488 family)
VIYNIGYAGRSLDNFVQQLNNLNITYLIDVRSLPFSGYFPEYNCDKLEEYLKTKNIQYVNMGALLGPRSKVISHYKPNGQIDFKILSKSTEFLKGIERLIKADKFNVCLMCAEKKPEVCHRSLLVSRYANEHGLDVQSIMFDGSVESLQETKNRLIKEKKLQVDFFTTKEELGNMVLDEQTDKFAYKK